MSHELRFEVDPTFSKIWLVACVLFHLLIIVYMIHGFDDPYLQLGYVLVFTGLCGYYCRQHIKQQLSFVFYTSGQLKFSDTPETLYRISSRSLSSDLFIILVLVQDKTAHKKRRYLYIMRDALEEADFRRLARTVNMQG